MDRIRLTNLIKYHLYSLKILIGILLLIMAINLALGIIFINNESTVGSIEIAAFGFAMFVGFELFKEAFTFSIINGISRKTYYLSNIISTLLISIGLGIVTGIATLISIAHANNIVLFTALYEENVVGLFIWCMALIFTMITLFHFSSLILYRVSKKVTYIIIAVLVLISPLLFVLNVMFDGFIANIQRFFLLFLGVYGDGATMTSNPFLSAGMLIGLSSIIIAISWLFLRRIEAK